MAKADSPAVGLMKYGVMLFSLAYLFMSIITSFHVVMRANSLPTTLVAIYFYTHVVANWMALFSHSNKDQGMDVPAISDVDQPAINKQSSSNYCSHCDILRHKLSHHCPLCRCCVLKHDHHCFFFGTCVGKNNQPFFVILCLYTGIGSLYLCLLIFQNSSWFFPAWYNYAELFMPFGVVFSLYRASNLYDAYMVIAYNASTTIGMVCLVMLGMSTKLPWPFLCLPVVHVVFPVSTHFRTASVPPFVRLNLAWVQHGSSRGRNTDSALAISLVQFPGQFWVQ